MILKEGKKGRKIKNKLIIMKPEKERMLKEGGEMVEVKGGREGKKE
jgi:hypothetical protein